MGRIVARPGRKDPIGLEEFRAKAQRLEFLKVESRRRRVALEPLNYGMPDLLFPQGMAAGEFDQTELVIRREPLDYEETDEQYKARQDKALYDLVTSMYVVKDDKFVYIKLMPKMVRLLADMFFGRINKVILWANRGGGKSLLAAIHIWISIVYHKRSFLNMGGAGNQARRVYDYTTQFWHNFPGMQEGFLIREPLLQRTELKNGTKLVCATSATTAIGEHVPGFTADESCTDRPGADEALLRAMQGALSEDNHQIFLLSTFHLPVGFFADVWDNAEVQGFTRVTWNCYDSMDACTWGLEKATPEDPKARNVCFTECVLTRTEPTYDDFGRENGKQWIGCQGRARHSSGWQSRDIVMDEMRMNIGTRIFPVEHECARPSREGQIYNRALIEKCETPSVPLCLDRKLTIGIDWGLTECAMLLLGEWSEANPEEPDFPIEGVCVISVVYMSGRLVDSVVDQIQRWEKDFTRPDGKSPKIRIRADGSHPYANKELANYGYILKQVYGDKGFMGSDNAARWIGSGHLKIIQGHELFLTQLHNLRRNILTGKQVKKNRKGDAGDHGPDALRFALMDYDYVKWVAAQKKKRERNQAKARIATKRRGRHLNIATNLDGFLR